jgi:hypothetical protein
MDTKLHMAYQQDLTDRKQYLPPHLAEHEVALATWEYLAARDLERLEYVISLLAVNALDGADDHFHAAMILFRSDETGMQLLAWLYASEAVRLGRDDAQAFADAAYERWQASIVALH